MSHLTTVRITTHAGTEYTLADVLPSAILAAVQKAKQEMSLVLVNASDVVLLLPSRIVASVQVDKEELWKD